MHNSKIFIAAAAALIVWSTVAFGQLTMMGAGGSGGGGGGGGGYVGPGDAVSGARAWYGLRAYNGAYAAATGAAIHVNGTFSSGDVDVLTNGDLNISQATAMSKTGLCGATIAGTTLTLTGTCLTNTINEIGDIITGAGITQPAYIVNIGSCASNTIGNTCTLNASQTVSSPESITVVQAMLVDKLYDQSGANACSSAPCTVLADTSLYPFFIPQCINGKPCLSSPAGVTGFISGSFTSTAEPYTLTALAQNSAGASEGTAITVAPGSSTGAGIFYLPADPNQTAIYAGSVQLVTATDNAPQDIEVLFNNTSSSVDVDGTTSAISPGTDGAVSFLNFSAAAQDYSHPLIGLETEGGIWPLGFSGGNFTAMHANICAYWNTTC